LSIVLSTKISGIIATNTTIQRTGLTESREHVEEMGNGGLSGKPLSKRATEVIRYLSVRSKGKIPIIGVGGIHSSEDVLEKSKAGAKLIQLYTGIIYEGPSLIRKASKSMRAIAGD
jgi:dihydroorotate dehydrogenase